MQYKDVLNELVTDNILLAANLHYRKHIVAYKRDGQKNMSTGLENNGLLYYGLIRHG